MRERYLVLGLVSAVLLISGGAFAHGKKNQGNVARNQGSQSDHGNQGKNGACWKTATTLRTACIADPPVNVGEASAKCLNMTDASAQKDCYATLNRIRLTPVTSVAASMTNVRRYAVRSDRLRMNRSSGRSSPTIL